MAYNNMITNLRVIRTSMGLTQGQAADKIGISRGLYSPIESGRYNPTETIKEKLADFFGHSADDLLKPATVLSKRGDL